MQADLKTARLEGVVAATTAVAAMVVRKARVDPFVI